MNNICLVENIAKILQLPLGRKMRKREYKRNVAVTYIRKYFRFPQHAAFGRKQNIRIIRLWILSQSTDSERVGRKRFIQKRETSTRGFMQYYRWQFLSAFKLPY